MVHGHGPRRHRASRARRRYPIDALHGRARARSGSRSPAPTCPTAAWPGGFDDVAWELSWEPSLPAAEHVHPLLRRAGIAKTILVLAHPDLAIAGTVRFAGRELVLDGARGGQAHLWGSKHAVALGWAHANDLREPRRRRRAPAPTSTASASSCPRFGRELGPSTPVVGRFGDDDFRATSPLARRRATRAASA